MISFGKLHIDWDWHCLHWPAFARGMFDPLGVEHRDEWEAVCGPLHVWWFRV